MSTEEQKRHEELLELIGELRNSSPALNGEFTKMSETIEKVREEQTALNIKMTTVMDKQDDLKDEVIKLNDAIYEPNSGLYKKLSDKAVVDQKQREDIDRLESEQKVLKAEVCNHKEEIKKLDSTENSLKKVAGERLEYLDNIVSTTKNIKRVFWIALAGLIGILVKEFGPALLVALAAL